MKILMIVSLVIFGIAVGASVALFYLTYIHKAQDSIPVATPETHQLEAFKIYNLINDYRASKGLNKLLYNPALCSFAKTRLQQIHSDWSHNGFNDAIKNKSYCTNPSSYCGENLGQGYDKENEQVKAWLQSHEHLENIENPHYTETCIVADTNGTEAFTVQEFISDY